MSYIYVITNDVNGKQYVGKTNYSIEKRFKQHINDSERKRCEKRPLYDAMNKYGIEHFSIEQLEECIPEETDIREQYWIDKLNTYHNGYNATYGGDGTILYNYQEIVEKYKELKSIKETATFFHCDCSVVTKACYNYGISSEEIFQNAKYIHAKKVAMLDKTSEQVIKVFNSIKDAARFLGDVGKHRHIGNVCNGKRQTAYGYKWQFVE